MVGFGYYFYGFTIRIDSLYSRRKLVQNSSLGLSYVKVRYLTDAVGTLYVILHNVSNM